MERLSRISIAVLLVLCMAGCAGASFGEVTERVRNLAHFACTAAVAYDADVNLGGLTPGEWCSIAENIMPFVEQLSKVVDEAKEKKEDNKEEPEIKQNPHDKQ